MTRGAARVLESAESDRLLAGKGDLDLFGRELDQLDQVLRRRVNADPERLEQGLARLVLTLIDLLRELMERQAIRRIEGGTLSAAGSDHWSPVPQQGDAGSRGEHRPHARAGGAVGELPHRVRRGRAIPEP
jgi:hypothetical protein